jgi:hypothetical protein
MTEPTCTHTRKGLCQSCTFAWMRTELERLNAENAQLRAELALERARKNTAALRAAEVAGEDVGDTPEMLLRGRCTCGDTFVAVTGAHDATCPVVRISDETGEQK